MSLNNIVDKLHEKYRKYKSDFNYNTSLVFSEIAGLAGSLGAVHICNLLGVNKYASTVGAAIASNYVAAVAGFSAMWYALNRKEYKGRFGKFLKETGEIIAKSLLPAAAGYMVYSPIAAGLVYSGLDPIDATLCSSILSYAVFFAGSNIANKRIIGKYRRDVGAIADNKGNNNDNNPNKISG